MTNLDLTKYKFYFDEKNKIVIAASTYAGCTIKAKAKCDPRDIYDREAGMALAAARCNAKIAVKRGMRANKKIYEAQKILDEARMHYEKMSEYYKDSQNAIVEANAYVDKLLKEM